MSLTFKIPGYDSNLNPIQKTESSYDPDKIIPETDENDEPQFDDNMIKAELEAAIQLYSEWAVENLEPLSEVDLENVEIEVGSMKRQAGKAMARGSKDNLNLTTKYSYRAYDKWGWEKFTSTIRHELIHIWQMQKLGEWDHGPSFKAKARKLDCSVKCENFHDEYKYELYCQECGDFIAGRHKKSKTVKYPGAYNSKCCGAPLRVEHK